MVNADRGQKLRFPPSLLAVAVSPCTTLTSSFALTWSCTRISPFCLPCFWPSWSLVSQSFLELPIAGKALEEFSFLLLFLKSHFVKSSYEWSKEKRHPRANKLTHLLQVSEFGQRTKRDNLLSNLYSFLRLSLPLGSGNKEEMEGG